MAFFKTKKYFLFTQKDRKLATQVPSAARREHPGRITPASAAMVRGTRQLPDTQRCVPGGLAGGERRARGEEDPSHRVRAAG